MNKSVLLVRHGRLAAPFDDYDRLSYDQLNQLSLGVVDPGIDREKALVPLQLLKQRSDWSSFEAVLVSESKRTRETAEIICPHLPVIKTSSLNEIIFDLSQLVMEEQFRAEGLPAVRVALFTALLEGKNVERLENVFRRVEELEKLIRESGFRSVICVTHGFLMRFLQLYFLRKVDRPQDVTSQLLAEVINPDYLQAIEVPES